MTTTPCFILGSGRSGTHSLARLLAQVPGVVAHHEYHCVEVQKLGALWVAGRLRFAETIDRLRDIYGAAVAQAERDGATHWVEVSNKASWLVPVIEALFPNRARYALVVRDGRKVVSSYYHKLAGEVYTDRGVRSLARYLDDETGQELPPPPEKEYWWPCPSYFTGDLLKVAQFRRLCWHWQEVSQRPWFDLLNHVSPDRYTYFRLEDLVNPAAPDLARLFGFLGLAYRPEHHLSLRRPGNVTEPVDYPLTPGQTEQFWGTPGVRELMENYGYTGPEYRVQYQPDEQEGYCGA